MAEVIMSVTINVREAGNATIVEVAGRVTLRAAGPSIQDTVRELVDSLRTRISSLILAVSRTSIALVSVS
jgi:hypothetical protein